MDQQVEENEKEQKEDDKPEALADLYADLDFDCEYTENLPALLKTLNISLAFTSYQAGRLMLIRGDGKSSISTARDGGYARFAGTSLAAAITRREYPAQLSACQVGPCRHYQLQLAFQLVVAACR